MRPSRQVVPTTNAPSQTTPPTFIDFFANENSERSAGGSDPSHQMPFAGLQPRGMTHHHPIDAMHTAASASAPPMSVDAIVQYLSSLGYAPRKGFLANSTIEHRLLEGGLRVETYHAALSIVHTPNHPVLRQLGVNASEREALMYRFASIAANRSGFRPEIKSITQHCNNDAGQLINGFLQYVRGE